MLMIAGATATNNDDGYSYSLDNCTSLPHFYDYAYSKVCIHQYFAHQF